MAAAAAARVFRGCRALMAPAAAGGSKRSASAAPAAGAGAKATKVAAAKDPAKVNYGIMKPVPISEELKRFAGGTPEISRAGAVKLVWDHIKAKGLQNPANRKEINCDDKLKSIFGSDKNKIGMMEISKLLSPHFIKTK